MNAKGGNEVNDYCLEMGRWGRLLAVLLLTRPSGYADAQGAKEPIRIGCDVR
jgi:hypothetical protein